MKRGKEHIDVFCQKNISFLTNSWVKVVLYSKPFQTSKVKFLKILDRVLIIYLWNKAFGCFK